MIGTTVLLALVSAASAALLPCRQVDTPAEVKCPIVFDGRVSSSLSAADFDSSSTSPFNPDYVKGEGLKWSEILKFPADAGRARFDDDTQKAFEVTISDKSIFQTQKGFRRAGLQFKGDSNDGSPAVKGVKTIHFSVKLDPQRPLNLSHEYLVRPPLISPTLPPVTPVISPVINIMGWGKRKRKGRREYEREILGESS